MRAARLHEIGGALRFDQDVPEPSPAAGEVLVELAYASVNPLDIWITQGSVGAAAANLPWIPGSEATGHLDGRPVLVRGAGIGVIRQGLSCERAAVPADAVHDVPDGLDLSQVAGLPVVGITAWNAVHDRAGVQAADRVLVLGASGGVGSIAVQIAKATGATVWGQTGRAENTDAITADGADRVVVADAAGLVDAVGDYAPTVVLDPLGGAFADAAIAAMADRGRLVVYGASDDEAVTLNWRRMYRKAITVLGYSGLIGAPAGDAEVMSRLLATMAEGRLRVRLGGVLALSDAAEAHARILERRAGGKLVLDCRG